MHEMAIIDNLLAIVNEQVKLNNLKKVNRVQLVVGELTGVVPDVMRFCWEVCTENTPLQGAELSIDWQPAVALCEKCDKEYEVKKQMDYSCPRCGGAIKDFVSGKELYVDFIDGE